MIYLGEKLISSKNYALWLIPIIPIKTGTGDSITVKIDSGGQNKEEWGYLKGFIAD